jgi:hypothetical protein
MMTKELRWTGSFFLFAGLLVCLFFPHRAAAQQFSAWSAPVNLNDIVLTDGTVCPAVVNSASNDNHPTISKDGLSLIFESNRPGPDKNGQIGLGGPDLWLAKRDSLDDCWQKPVNLGPVVNSPFMDGSPNLTTDGHWLYFHSDRPTWLTPDGFVVPSCGGVDLYVSHRKDAGDDFGWENPINLGCTINTPGFDQAGPLHFEDDATGIHFLYFTQKPLGASGTLFDIYVSTCNADLATCNRQGLWGLGTPVVALNSPFRDTRTAIRRRDGLEMILSSGRTPGSLLNENLWVSTRPAVTLDQENWAPPEPVNCDNMPGCSPWNPRGPLINSDAFDGAPALSWDGTELYFFSERTDLPGFAGGRDLYVSKRTKIAGSN